MWRSLTYFTTILIVNSFLSFIAILYSNVDLFKVDLVETRKKDQEAMSNLSLILKNNYLLFVSICIIQNILSFFLSKLIENFSSTRLTTSIVVFILSFFIMIFTEIIPNYIASKEYFKSLVLNKYLLKFVYLITLVFSPLKIFIKERKKFFTHSEEDLIRFINNLTSKEILLLEPKEAQLVNLAFSMDDNDIGSVIIPINKTICLYSSMKLDEIKDIYLTKNMSKYPVFDSENGKFLGILNIKGLVFSLLRNDFYSEDWKTYINKNIIFLKKDTKLSNALEILKNSRSHISIVKENDKILGIVTLKDILGSLVGKIYDEKLTG